MLSRPYRTPFTLLLTFIGHEPIKSLLTVPKHSAPEPQSALRPAEPNRDRSSGTWVRSEPKAAATFSAVGYHFGRHLRAKTGRPVGLINTSWGGTPSEAWTREATLKSGADSGELKTVKPLLDRWAGWVADEAAGRPTPGGRTGPLGRRHHHHPGNLNNGMIAPLVPFTVKGAVWYQGESNANRAAQYDEIFPVMIEDWRDQWGDDFPFLWVQLANFQRYSENPNATAMWAELREAQDNTLTDLENTGQAVITDIGEANDIHPRNKEDVGERLALAALRLAYGADAPGLVSPRVKDVAIDGATATVTFDVDGDALQVRRDELDTPQIVDPGEAAGPGDVLGFAVAGPDGKFARAAARITGPDTVEVVAPAGVPKIAAVRYAWADNPRVTLFNTRGLPAAPFRTDDLERVTAGNY